MTAPEPLWALQARQWALLTPPLRPSGPDLVWAQETIDRWTRDRVRAPTAVVLGVTPELATLGWPATSMVVATDISMPVMRGVWPAETIGTARRPAVQANWLALPLADRSCDLVFGDGCFANIRRTEWTPLARSVRRLLATDGAFTTRIFVQPARTERPDDIWQQLLDRQIGSFAAFKLRLLMSLCRDDGEVEVHHAWDYFRSRAMTSDALAAHLGAPVEEIRTIEAYRDQSAVYCFPTIGDFEAALAEQFERVGEPRWPDYELGERCPTYVVHP